jgi:transglutaminase-like putative cysteine protease
MSTTIQARLTVAAVVATMLSALTLSPLVQGKAWLVAVFVLVAVVAGVGAAVRQVTRSWPLVVLAQVASFVVAITALFVRDSAVLGVFPGPAAVSSLVDLLQVGAEVTRTAGPPVSPAAGLILLVAGGIGLVGLAVDVIAVSLRKPAVAGLPLLAVYCVPAAVLPDGVSWGWFVLAGLGYLLLIAADSTERIRGWGRVLGDLGPDGDGRAMGGGPLSGARRIGVGALAVAVLLPPLVPGLGEQLLGSGGGDGPGRGNRQIKVLNPILDLRANLNARSNETILTYRLSDGASPQPLRVVADTQYDGSSWAPLTGKAIPAANRVQEQFGAPAGLGPSVATKEQQVRVEVGAYQQNFLPLPYPTYRVDIEGTWLWDAATLNVVGEGVDTQNREYTAYYLAVSPRREQLDAAGTPPSGLAQDYTKLPDTFPAALTERAEQVGGQGTAYEKAARLQKFFREGGFSYDTKAPVGSGRDDSQQDVLVKVLEVKRGYCVHFASAMAVMARALGIPARVAVGFLPGSRRADGSYAVSLQDAHAWPELYFEGAGWVRFEPTPGRVINVPGYTEQEDQQPTPTNSPSASASGPSNQPTARRPDENTPVDGATTQPPLVERILAATPWRVVAGFALLGLLLLVPLAAATIVRRRRWGRARTAVARAEAAWEDLRERLADLGVRWASSWTPRALQRRLVEDHALGGSPQAALGRLVTALEEARYMPPSAPGPDVDELDGDVRTVADGVAATLSRRARRRARWLPSTGVAALRGIARDVDAAADEAGRRAAALGAQVRETVGARRGGHSTPEDDE